MLPARTYRRHIEKPHTCWQHRRCLEWRRGLQPTSTNAQPAVPERPCTACAAAACCSARCSPCSSPLTRRSREPATRSTARPRHSTTTSRISLSAVSWPQQGQAALVLGNGRPAASPHEQPVADRQPGEGDDRLPDPRALPAERRAGRVHDHRHRGRGAGRGPGAAPGPVGRGGAGRRAADRAPAAGGAADPLRQQHRRRCSPPGWRAARRASSPR